MLAWQGGRFATHNKQNAEHTKQNPEQKSHHFIGFKPATAFLFWDLKKRRCGELRIPGTTLPSWDAEQTSSSAPHPRNDFAFLGCGADEFVCPMLPTRRFAAEGRGGSEPKGMAVTRMDVAWRGTRRGRACASSALNQRERPPSLGRGAILYIVI